MFLNKFSRHEMRAMQELEAADEVTETRIRSLRLAVITHPFGTERDNTFARASGEASRSASQSPSQSQSQRFSERRLGRADRCSGPHPKR
jgi:hypothetical protein